MGKKKSRKKSAKLERCVKSVKKQGKDIGAAYAICNASLGKKRGRKGR